MALQINTGPITSTGAVTMFSPSTTSSTGEWIGNLDGRAWRDRASPDLSTRTSWPATLRCALGLGSGRPGRGWYYQRMKVRFSPNWTNGQQPGHQIVRAADAADAAAVRGQTRTTSLAGLAGYRSNEKLS